MAEETPEKTLKNLADAIEGLSKLEGDLQQQLGKTDGPLRHQVAVDLANAIGARIKLVEDRSALLKIISSSPGPPPPPAASAKAKP
jgi:hypothetical protein